MKYCLCKDWKRFLGDKIVDDDELNLCPFCGKKIIEEKPNGQEAREDNIS